MLVSNDLKAIEKARFLATQARDKALHYQHSQIGYNYRMSNILAGMGIAQMKVIEERVSQKKAIFRRYREQLKEMKGITFMPQAEDTLHNRWLSTLTVDPAEYESSPEDIVMEMEKDNIEARPLWKPLHLQPLFRNYRFYQHSSETSICERLYQTGICLPSGTGMSETDQQRVIRSFQSAVALKVRKPMLRA